MKKFYYLLFALLPGAVYALLLTPNSVSIALNISDSIATPVLLISAVAGITLSVLAFKKGGYQLGVLLAIAYGLAAAWAIFGLWLSSGNFAQF